MGLIIFSKNKIKNICESIGLSDKYNIDWLQAAPKYSNYDYEVIVAMSDDKSAIDFCKIVNEAINSVQLNKLNESSLCNVLLQHEPDSYNCEFIEKPNFFMPTGYQARAKIKIG